MEDTRQAQRMPRSCMDLLGLLFIVVAGGLNATQTAMNAQLNKSIGQIALAAPVVFLVGLAGTLPVLLFMGANVDYTSLREPPWWAFLGGLCGAFLVYAMLSQTQKIGPGVFVATSVTASIVTSVVIDHFGALGADLHPATLWRVVGVVLMLVGVALVGKF